MSFIGKIRDVFRNNDLRPIGGFSVGGAQVVDSMPPKPEPTAQEIATAKRREEIQKHKETRIKGRPSGKGLKEKSDFLARRFNYERHATFPWGLKQDYEAGDRSDLRKVMSGREYSIHAIDRAKPADHGGRGIPTKVVEHTIAYGERKTDFHPKTGQLRYYREKDGVIVGVTKDEKIVTTVRKGEWEP